MGAFWQPRAVLCDTDHLRTLPARERTNGYGELARCHFIGVAGIHRLPLEEQITASVARKAEIVTADERDTGLRHLLNYGHTLGHALERATDFRVRHGEAVAVGTVFAGRLARALGRIDEERCTEHHAVVAGYGVPTRLPATVDVARLIDLMWLDKKATAGLGFVLDGPRGGRVGDRRSAGRGGRLSGGDAEGGLNGVQRPLVLAVRFAGPFRVPGRVLPGITG